MYLLLITLIKFILNICNSNTGGFYCTLFFVRSSQSVILFNILIMYFLCVKFYGSLIFVVGFKPQEKCQKRKILCTIRDFRFDFMYQQICFLREKHMIN